MRHRIFYLAPDLACARNLMNDLLLARVEERHIHVLAKRGTSMEGLHEASVLQKSDFVHAAQLGLMLGAALGCALGAAIAYGLADSDGARIAAVLVSTVLGALFGTWVSSMVGASVPNSRLRRFGAALEQGRILLIVDVPAGRLDAVRSALRQSHPECEDLGLDPHVPAFP